jgi:two-component system cell cycle sensor histidine kinase/response regulator CckA
VTSTLNGPPVKQTNAVVFTPARALLLGPADPWVAGLPHLSIQTVDDQPFDQQLHENVDLYLLDLRHDTRFIEIVFAKARQRNLPVIALFNDKRSEDTTPLPLDPRFMSFITPSEITRGLAAWRIEIALRQHHEEKQRLSTAESKIRHELQTQRTKSIVQLAGGLAHDFNNLFTPILGHAHIVLDIIEEDHPVRDSMEEILKAAERAAKINKDLLLFSRRKVSRSATVDLHRIIESHDEPIRRALGEYIELTIDLQARHSTLLADHAQIAEAIQLMATNTEESLNGKPGTFTVSTQDITVTGANDPTGIESGSYFKLTVSDSGPGIPKEHHEKVIEPFFTTKDIDHAGLGLAIVSGIVAGHNGYLCIEHSSPTGTSINLYFPQTEGGGGSPQKEGSPFGQKSTVPKGSGERILVVDDDPAVLLLACATLKSLGYTTVSAPSGDEALVIFKEEMDSIQLVLTDMVMPRMDGTRLVQHLRELKPDVRVLYASGYSQERIASTDINLDTNFIAKPFSRANLGRMVQHILTQ